MYACLIRCQALAVTCRDLGGQLQVPVAAGKRKRQKPKLTVEHLKVTIQILTQGMFKAQGCTRSLLFCRNATALQKCFTRSQRSSSKTLKVMDMRSVSSAVPKLQQPTLSGHMSHAPSHPSNVQPDSHACFRQGTCDGFWRCLLDGSIEYSPMLPSTCLWRAWRSWAALMCSRCKFFQLTGGKCSVHVDYLSACRIGSYANPQACLACADGATRVAF